MSASTIPSPNYIYKIAPSTPKPLSPSPDSSDAILPVSSLDNSSGYIHMSTTSQIAGTLKLFFATSADEENEVWLLKVKVDSFGDENVKWESPDGTVTGDRQGEGLFPHLYLRESTEGEGEGHGEKRLWLRRDEVVDVRRVVCGKGQVSWEGGIDGLVGDGWLV